MLLEEEERQELFIEEEIEKKEVREIVSICKGIG